MVPLHLGALHPFEQALVLLVAFGPFVVLGVVVHRARRRAMADDPAPSEDSDFAQNTRTQSEP